MYQEKICLTISADILNAKSILKSSVIIPSSSVLRKGRTKIRLTHRVGFTPALKDILQSNELYTLQEVADRFSVTDKAVYKWIKQNKIEWERTSQHSRDIRILKNQLKSPPAEALILEKSIFNDAVEMELVNRKGLYRDED